MSVIDTHYKFKQLLKDGDVLVTFNSSSSEAIIPRHYHGGASLSLILGHGACKDLSVTTYGVAGTLTFPALGQTHLCMVPWHTILEMKPAAQPSAGAKVLSMARYKERMKTK